jgi:hypothetical protein
MMKSEFKKTERGFTPQKSFQKTIMLTALNHFVQLVSNRRLNQKTL